MALALILYEGGLSSGWAEIKPVIRVSVLLATVGTIITAGLTAIAALFLFTELSTLEALMLGSTVAATDAAAVFAVLRGSTLRRRIARTLEGESGVNDPVAVLLVLGLHRGDQARRLRDRSTRCCWRSRSSRSAPASGSPSASSGRSCCAR